MIKRNLTTDDLYSMLLDISDDILQTEKGGLNFYISAYDYAYIWAGLYKDYTELNKSLEENDCGFCSMYCNYFPETRKVILSFEDVNYEITKFEINDGIGKDTLINLCEQYCLETENKTCKELLRST